MLKPTPEEERKLAECMKQLHNPSRPTKPRDTVCITCKVYNPQPDCDTCPRKQHS